MKLSEIKKLKKGTPVKVVWRKFPYIGKFGGIEDFNDEPGDRYVYVRMHFADQVVAIDGNFLCPIEGLTQFKKS